MKLDTNKHSVFLLYYHLVLVTKYRRQVFDDEISDYAKTTFERISESYCITLVEWNHDKDHVHIMFKAQPKTALTKFINAYKSASSRLIKRDFPRVKQFLLKEMFFSKTFGCVLKVYNLMLDDRKKAYEEVKNDSSKKMTFPISVKYKKAFPFLKEVDSLALANAQLNLDKAYKNFFRDKSVGFPRFKSKKNHVQSYTTNNQNGTVALIDSKFIKVPKLKSLIRIKLHRQPKGIIKSATISHHSSGKYYISLLCKEEIIKLPKTNSAIGIDLGIKHFAILSNGQKIDNNRFTFKMEKKLKREQRKLSRRALFAKSKGINLFEAKNYQKQKRKVARFHEKVMNQRTDFLNKLSTEIIKNHDIICIEDLNTKGMLRNHKLSKSISDVSWSSFVTKLQ